MWLRPLLRELKSKAFSAGRLAVFLAAGSTVVAGVAYGLTSHVVPSAVSHPYFGLESIRLISDVKLDDPGALVARGALYEGTSLWSIDPVTVESSIAELPWVREAELERRFPSEVILRVYKREAVAATIHGGRVFLVDAAGMVYQEPSGKYPDVPYLTGWSEADSLGARRAALRRSMQLVFAAEAAGVEASQVDVGADGLMWLYLDEPGIPVMLGRRVDAASAIRRLQVVLRSVSGDGREIEQIDLSLEGRAVVRARDGQLPVLLSRVHREAGGSRLATAEASGGERG